MEKLTYIKDEFQNGVHRPSLTCSSSRRDVSYRWFALTWLGIQFLGATILVFNCKLKPGVGAFMRYPTSQKKVEIHPKKLRQMINVGIEFVVTLEPCGSCGYALNLCSSNRNISTIGSKYGKSIKRGIISFFYIDDSRFTQVDEIQCIPHFSKRSWGLFQRRIKLLCCKCNNHIGIAYDEFTSSHPIGSEESDSSSGHEVSKHRKYDIRIRALQPLSSEETALEVASA